MKKSKEINTGLCLKCEKEYFHRSRHSPRFCPLCGAFHGVSITHGDIEVIHKQIEQENYVNKSYLLVE